MSKTKSSNWRPEMCKTCTQLDFTVSWLYDVLCLGMVYLSKCPSELHVLGRCIAALQKPGSAVHVHQTLVIIIVNCRTQHSQVKLLGTGVVHVLLGNKQREIRTCPEEAQRQVWPKLKQTKAKTNNFNKKKHSEAVECNQCDLAVQLSCFKYL